MAMVHYTALSTPEIPHCSICIANYNGEDVLAACLNSVLNQITDYRFEIIIHDDASSDRSVEIIQRCYPQVKLIVSEKNVGFCVSNNRMVAVASGKYILLLNNDAALFPDALQKLADYAEVDLNPVIR